MPENQLRARLQVLRRRKWWVIASVVVVPLLAVTLSLLHQRLYQADAQVLITNQNLAAALSGTQQFNGVNVQADRVAQTQAELARVPKVAQAALAATHLNRSVTDFLANSGVHASANADLLTFSVTDPDPTIAARLATAYAAQFVKYRQTLDTASVEKARAEVQTTISKLPTSQGSLYRDLIAKDQQLATMEALQTANASLVEPATSAQRVQPRPVRNGVIGLILGAVLGVGFAFLWEALDTRVRSDAEIESLLDVPLLARLPAPPSGMYERSELVTVTQPQSVGAEAFRILRTNLELVRIPRRAKTLLVTSSVAGEGKSTTVANLAVALARSGKDVAVVDLDLRRPRLQNFFGSPDSFGALLRVAMGETSLDEGLHFVPAVSTIGADAGGAGADGTAGAVASLTRVGALAFLGTGAPHPHPGEFVGSTALADILSELRERFDVVLIDVPPALLFGDTLVLANHADAVLVVARMDLVRRPMLTELRRVLSSSPAPALGLITTGRQRKADAEGYGNYAYGYGYTAD
jgi:succinoglycan biosynthesis transport protein ExoP